MARFTTLTDNVERTHAVVLDAGDSAMDELITFARSRRLRSASFTGIGAFSRAMLAFFDVEAKQYRDIPVGEQSEVLSLVGDIVRAEDGDWQVHAHVVLGLRDGSTRGGHLRSATVRPTLEVVVTETSQPLRRRHDEVSGLALIDLADGSPIEDPNPLRHGLAP